MRRVLVTAVCLAVTMGLMYMDILLVRHSWASFSRMPTGAMRPTLEVGDEVVIDRRKSSINDIALGDVVVFEYPLDRSVEYIKMPDFS